MGSLDRGRNTTEKLANVRDRGEKPLLDFKTFSRNRFGSKQENRLIKSQISSYETGELSNNTLQVFLMI